VVVDGENGASGQAATRQLVAFVEPTRRSRPLPIPGAVAETGYEAMRRVTATIDAAALGAFLQALDDAALLSMARALAPAFIGDERRTVDQVLAALDADEGRAHLVGRWLASLVTAERLRADGDTFHRLVVPEPDEVERAWERAAELERVAGWSADLFSVVRRCASELDALLRGDRTIESVLFADASADAMDAAYRGNVVARTLQQVIADGVREIAATHTGGPLRIMEVGLRGGGAAAGVLPALAGLDVDYLATDTSALTRVDAAARWAGDERVRVAEFDPAAGIREQGFLPNSVDVLVSAGVLNNVADVDDALGRLRELVAPGGWLVLLENTDDRSAALQISTEFLEAHSGPFTDVRAAGRQSFLRSEQWRDALAACGTRVVAEFPDQQSPLSAAGQRLFLVQLKPDREPVAADELARRVGTRLPDYMVPTRWQIVDSLPLTDNGKIDHRALRAWLATDTGTGTRSEQPIDELESRLAQLWAELLGCATVGRHDDLFALGGDSLLVARLVGRLRDGLGDVGTGPGTGTAEWDLEWEVVLRHLLRNPTVAGLASYLRTVQATDAGAGTVAPASPVVWLNGTAADPVTVLVHAGTGTLLPYRPLVTEMRRRAGGVQNLVGLEIAAVDEFLDADPDGLVDRIAADYVKAVAATGCTRFDIVGYCVGGVIATEVARGLAEAGADVRSLTLISSHTPRFRIDDEMLSEYSFALMMGMDLARIGFPADQARVGAAAGAVLDRTPDAIRDGAISSLTGEYADIAAAFGELEALPRMRRVARMCEAVPAELAGTYEPEGMLRTLRIYQQSTFALSRHQTEPYAGDITFLRHSGAYPFPGTADSVTEHWARLCLGELRSIDIPGHHFSCMTAQYVDTVFGHLAGLIDGLADGRERVR
jgi:pyochelin synthetase